MNIKSKRKTTTEAKEEFTKEEVALADRLSAIIRRKEVMVKIMKVNRT